jgi:hypothetical protein
MCSVPDEGESRNVACPLKLISTLLLLYVSSLLYYRVDADINLREYIPILRKQVWIQNGIVARYIKTSIKYIIDSRIYSVIRQKPTLKIMESRRGWCWMHPMLLSFYFFENIEQMYPRKTSNVKYNTKFLITKFEYIFSLIHWI